MKAHGLSRRKFFAILLAMPLLGALHATRQIKPLPSSGFSNADDEYLVLDGWILLKTDIVDWVGGNDAH